jgi:hypothetical protein
VNLAGEETLLRSVGSSAEPSGLSMIESVLSRVSIRTRSGCPGAIRTRAVASIPIRTRAVASIPTRGHTLACTVDVYLSWDERI